MTDKGAQRIALSMVISALVVLCGLIGYDQYKEWRAERAVKAALASAEKQWEVQQVAESEAYIEQAKKQLAEQGVK